MKPYLVNKIGEGIQEKQFGVSYVKIGPLNWKEEFFF